MKRFLVMSVAFAVLLVVDGGAPGWATGGPTPGDGSSSVDGAIGGDGEMLELEGSRRSDDAEGQPGSGPPGSGQSGSAPPVSGGSPPEPEPPVDALEPSWGQRPETGEPCIALTPVQGIDPGSELGLIWDLATLEMMADPRLSGIGDLFCEPLAAAAAATSPEAVVHAFVRSIALPVPELRVDPGIALTGLPAYLVIEGQDDFTLAEPIAGWGTLAVSFEVVSLVVDWGDGTVDLVEDGRSGAPYGGEPAEQISHVYDQRDPDSEVVVSSSWRARWSVGGFSGDVSGLAVDAALPLPVREYRAVRVAPDGR